MKTLSTFLGGGLLTALLSVSSLQAQHLTLEGQTGGFLTPTAYVVYTAPGKTFSSPAVGYHFIDASKVIGNVQTFSVVEGVANRAEIGYTRSVHTTGSATTAATLYLSNLWKYDGMNIVSGKLVLLKDGQGSPLTPGVAVGGLARFGDHFVSGAIGKELGGEDKGYTNGDVYVAASKTWLHKPVPLLANLGWKVTNASIFGLGGQSTRFGGEFFGGLGIPLPLGHGMVVVPSGGFTREPKNVKNLKALLPGGTHIPTTVDYALRITQKEHPHFSFDAGFGHVAGVIGTTYVVAGGKPVPVPVDLKANRVFGMGLSYRY
jgi:hypothetical protein